MGLSPSKKTNVLFLAKIAPYALRARACNSKIARGEMEFLFGQFKMASNFFSFDLAYLLIGYFSGINLLSQDEKLERRSGEV